MDLAAASQAIVDRLSAAGIRATLDERDANPPAVLVRAPVIAWRFARGDFEATWTLWCVVPNSGRDAALRNLGPLVQATAEALGVHTLTAEPADLPVPEQAAPLPAYRLTFIQQIRQPPGGQA